VLLAPSALLGPPRSLLCLGRWSPPVGGGCPSPEPGSHGPTRPVEPLRCIGRYEGTEKFLGRRDSPEPARHSSSQRRAHLHQCLGPPRGCPPDGHADRTRCQGLTTLLLKQSGKKQKNPLSGVVCPLTTGDLIRVRCSVGMALRFSRHFPSPDPPAQGHRTGPGHPYGMPSAALRQASICSIDVAERRPKTRKMSA
jgi:hypothetical protein